MHETGGDGDRGGGGGESHAPPVDDGGGLLLDAIGRHSYRNVLLDENEDVDELESFGDSIAAAAAARPGAHSSAARTLMTRTGGFVVGAGVVCELEHVLGRQERGNDEVLVVPGSNLPIQ